MIAVIIPTFNRRSHLQQVLDDLLNQKFHQAELRIYVVVDGSTDGTIEMINNLYPEVIIIQGTGNWWFTHSVNQGLRKAFVDRADHFLIINDDVRLDSDYMSYMWRAGLTFKGSVIGSVSYVFDNKEIITFSGVKEIVWWRYKQVNYIPPYTKVMPDTISGCRPSVVLPGRGLFFDSYIYETLNGLDDTFVQYASDDDFCLRAKAKGFAVLVNYDAKVYTKDKLTGVGNPRLKMTFKQQVLSFFNPYSPRSLRKTIHMVWRYGSRIYLPLTILIVIFGSIRASIKSDS